MSICIFGDSITWGASDTEKGGWVERLKIYVGEKHDDEVYNLGISGNNTDDLLKRVENESRIREPNIIMFAIGINDSQYVRSEDKNRVPLERFRDNILKLYKTARQFSEKIVFVGLTSVDESKIRLMPWNTDKEYSNESIRRYDEAIREFCSENALKFIPMNNVIGIKELDDGLHPNSQGHEKMFDKIRPEIDEVLSM